MDCPHEAFPALAGLPVIHAFTGRVPGLDVRTDRATALARLEDYHRALRESLGLGARRFLTANQVHGASVAAVDFHSPAEPPEADALITADPRVCLGIYVADCGPVFLVDPVRRAIGCVHSGRKGTELGVVPAAMRAMGEKFGSRPGDITVQLGPCIRPPQYEVDFAAQILADARAAGAGRVEDCATCTGSDLTRYYSYRVEKGQTGRMLALLALAE